MDFNWGEMTDCPSEVDYEGKMFWELLIFLYIFLFLPARSYVMKWMHSIWQHIYNLAFGLVPQKRHLCSLCMFSSSPASPLGGGSLKCCWIPWLSSVCSGLSGDLSFFGMAGSFHVRWHFSGIVHQQAVRNGDGVLSELPYKEPQVLPASVCKCERIPSYFEGLL